MTIYDDDGATSLTFEDHSKIGEKLKRYACGIEQIRAEIASSYPKSSKREMARLDKVFNDIRALQTSLHNRLLIEYREKSDDELLPVYMGRPHTPNYS
jgi:hypothetical protein